VPNKLMYIVKFWQSVTVLSIGKMNACWSITVRLIAP